MRLYLIRHGESLANKDKIVQGQLDSPLSNLGLKQARLVGSRFKDYSFCTIYSSDLSRAKVTAEHINQHHKHQIIEDRRLREVSRGDLSGIPFSKIDWTPFNADFYGFRPKNGENIYDQIKRIENFYNSLPLYKNVLVVSHGWTIKCFLHVIFNLPLEEVHHNYRTGNTCIYCIDLTDKNNPRLLIENCLKHLNTKEILNNRS